MWSRVVEFMLGVWLALSPFIFRHATGEVVLWTHDFVVAVLLMGLSLLSYWTPTRHAHLASFLVGLWLCGFGRFLEPGDVQPASQNHIVVGLLLLMFAVIPNDAARPPREWFERSPETRLPN